jgi:hypothetical protein
MSMSASPTRSLGLPPEPFSVAASSLAWPTPRVVFFQFFPPRQAPGEKKRKRLEENNEQ